ncbi:hypothetical protein J6590_070196 [Homalodisca vitripennis]|nr:hypothetical protein J6590_070196 [Homalodisca vitripennis]
MLRTKLNGTKETVRRYRPLGCNEQLDTDELADASSRHNPCLLQPPAHHSNILPVAEDVTSSWILVSSPMPALATILVYYNLLLTTAIFYLLQRIGCNEQLNTGELADARSRHNPCLLQPPAHHSNILPVVEDVTSSWILVSSRASSRHNPCLLQPPAHHSNILPVAEEVTSSWILVSSPMPALAIVLFYYNLLLTTAIFPVAEDVTSSWIWSRHNPCLLQPPAHHSNILPVAEDVTSSWILVSSPMPALAIVLFYYNLLLTTAIFSLLQKIGCNEQLDTGELADASSRYSPFLLQPPAHHINILPVAEDVTSSWILVSSPMPALATVLVYLVLVLYVGPRLMAGRKPLQLRKTMMIYNVFQVLFNCWMLYMTLATTDAFKYMVNHSCRPAKVDDLRYTFHIYSWCYFVSKIIDLLDTMFMVLRKKDSHITFLHLYHHVSMVLFTWVSVKYIQGKCKESNEDSLKHPYVA